MHVEFSYVMVNLVYVQSEGRNVHDASSFSVFYVIISTIWQDMAFVPRNS